MKNFLIRLFNLEPKEIECPSCKVYKHWVTRLEDEADLLRAKVQDAHVTMQSYVAIEREQRQELEDVILKFVRIKSAPAQ